MILRMMPCLYSEKWREQGGESWIRRDDAKELGQSAVIGADNSRRFSLGTEERLQGSIFRYRIRHHGLVPGEKISRTFRDVFA
jgi:hypothetical protein